MKTRLNNPARLVRAAVLAGLYGIVLAHSAMAEIKGIVIKHNGQRIPQQGGGSLRYLPAQKKYLINAGGVQMQIPLAQVKEVRTVKPKQLDAAIRAVQTGSYSAAIPVLERIMKDYRMLQWDIPAAENLTLAYLKMGQASKAVQAAELAIEASPAKNVYSGDLARYYWKALIEAKRTAKLRKILLEAVEYGSREVAANAQVMRGNIDFEHGNYKDALVDGYLRTIVLFQDVKKVQPEALYQAIQAHEKLGEHSHAEKWRKKLLSEFPDSSYSKKLQTGS